MKVENFTNQKEIFEYIEGNIHFHSDENLHLCGQKGDFLKFRVRGKNFMIKIHKEDLLQKLNIDHGKIFIYITSESIAKTCFFDNSGNMFSNIDKIIDNKHLAINSSERKIKINNNKEALLSTKNHHSKQQLNGDIFYLFDIQETIQNATPIIQVDHHEF